MTADRETIRIVRAWLDAGPTEIPDRVLRRVLEEVPQTRQRRAHRMGRVGDRRRLGALLVAAASMLAALLGGSALVGNQQQQIAPVPSQLGTREGWPGPLRSNDATGVVPVTDTVTATDGVGDIGADLGHLDITWLEVRGGQRISSGQGFMVRFRLAGRPAQDPGWRLGYGVVVDLDADGVPDYQVGMDALDPARSRQWISNLVTRETIVNTGFPGGYVGFDIFFDTFFPGDWAPTAGQVYFMPDCRTDSIRFYVWASALRDGAHVATDVAPDDGWFEVYRGEPIDPQPTGPECASSGGSTP